MSEITPAIRSNEATRWKPGQSGNPSGQKTAGAMIKHHLNGLSVQDLSEDEIRAIARDKSIGWTRRAAAERILRTLEAGDLADFDPFFEDGAKLKDLRKQGINTEVVKKRKEKRREIPQAAGAPIIEVEREIELYDRSGVDFDRVMDRTEGTPTASLAIRGAIQHVRTFFFASGSVPAWLADAAPEMAGSGGHVATHDGEGSIDRGASGDGQEPGVSGEVRGSL